MTEWLIRRFVPDSKNIRDERVRLSYGTLSSVVGILCNIFLFILKLLIGILIHSVSIISDGFNNLTDCISCIVTLLGYHLAAKPADKEHPFGHGRMEYVVSFFSAVLIFLVGWELLKQSIQNIISPSFVNFSWSLFVILACSILVKLWMSSFNSKLGKKLDNVSMMAAAQDSRNDVLTTGISLAALVLDLYFPSVPFDGIGGLFVSCIIFKDGFEISKEIISRLLGRPASSELTEKIRTIMLSQPDIIGVHDLIIHDYGPGSQFGSAHAEIDSHKSFAEAHAAADAAERQIERQLHVLMTIHMDPVDAEDPLTEEYQDRVKKALRKINWSLTIHDFRIVRSTSYIRLVFDILEPYECPLSKKDILKRIYAEFQDDPLKVQLSVTIDHPFEEEKQ